MNSGADLVSMFGQIAELKRLKRTGWLDRGVPREEVESVADHSLNTSVIAWVVACDDMSLDSNRVLQLAMIHDLAESIAGDPAPYDQADIPSSDDHEARAAFFSVRHARSSESSEIKRATENAAVEQLIALMSERAAANLRSLWDEYEAQETAESKFVKQVDRLEAFLQSRDYVDRFPTLTTDGFRLQALEEITHPVLVEVRDERLRRER